MKKYYYLTAVTIILGAIIGISFKSVLAQNNNDVGQALEIGPPVINLSADPGEVIKRQINIRDISSGPLVVTSQVNDFVAAGEDGTPKVLLDETEAEGNPYSLKSWIEPLPPLTLQPKQVETLTVKIHVPSNASPGSYYGLIRFSAVPPDLEGQGVSLSASLGSLVLLRVNGDAKESLEIEEFYASKNGEKSSLLESSPVDFVARLKNTGNVHLQPAGKISIEDMFGNHVANTFINQPPRNVLPDSIRRFEQKLDEEELGSKRLFGRYKAELTVTYGDNKQTTTSEITFWVIPYKLIGIVIAVLLAAFLVLRFMLKRYTRRAINRSHRRR